MKTHATDQHQIRCRRDMFEHTEFYQWLEQNNQSREDYPYTTAFYISEHQRLVFEIRFSQIHTWIHSHCCMSIWRSSR